MSEYGNITATVRSNHGKGVARSLRRDGHIPAIVYGQGKENLSLTLDPRLFHKATDPAREWNTFYRLTIKEDGKADVVETCVLADVQLHNVRRDILHLDFMRVDPEKEIIRKVPVQYSGRAAGVAKGGKLKMFRRFLKVAAKPAELPVAVEVDVTPVEAGEFFRIKDVVLPTGRIMEKPETNLAAVMMPKVKAGEGEEAAAGKK